MTSDIDCCAINTILPKRALSVPARCEAFWTMRITTNAGCSLPTWHSSRCAPRLTVRRRLPRPMRSGSSSAGSTNHAAIPTRSLTLHERRRLSVLRSGAPALLCRAHFPRCKGRTGMGGVRGAQISRLGTSPGIDGRRVVVRGTDQAGVGARVLTRHPPRAGNGCAGIAGAVDGESA